MLNHRFIQGSEQNNLTIVLLARDNILFEALKDNFNFSSELQLIKTNWQNFINNSTKIDLLIVDSIDSPDLMIPDYKTRLIANLNNYPLSKKEIRLPKPIKLSELAVIIKNITTTKALFVNVMGNWIYNEFDSSISCDNEILKLTEKENSVISYLLRNGSICNKKTIFAAVWQYNENSETSTLETHLYKLKQKLPENMFKISGDICELITEN